MGFEFLENTCFLNVKDSENSRFKSCRKEKAKRVTTDTGTSILFWIRKLVSLLEFLRVPESNSKIITQSYY